MALRRFGYWAIYAGIAAAILSYACKATGAPAIASALWIATLVLGGIGLLLLALYYIGRLFRVTPAVRR